LLCNEKNKKAFVLADWVDEMKRKGKPRTVEFHERIERPPLGIVVLPMFVRPTKRPGYEMSSSAKSVVIANFRPPLVRVVRMSARSPI
jgi:hypothetical protein